MRLRRPVPKADTERRDGDPGAGATGLKVLEPGALPGGAPDPAAHQAFGSLESMFHEISFGDSSDRQDRPGEAIGKYDDLWQLSLSDPLTGLANRMLLLDRLTRELTRRQRHGGCVIVSHIDLDNLKDINDEFGYSSGTRSCVGCRGG